MRPERKARTRQDRRDEREQEIDANTRGNGQRRNSKALSYALERVHWRIIYFPEWGLSHGWWIRAVFIRPNPYNRLIIANFYLRAFSSFMAFALLLKLRFSQHSELTSGFSLLWPRSICQICHPRKNISAVGRCLGRNMSSSPDIRATCPAFALSIPDKTIPRSGTRWVKWTPSRNFEGHIDPNGSCLVYLYWIVIGSLMGRRDLSL